MRTFLKAVSWETFSTTAMVFLAWAMFGHFSMCIVFSVVAFAIKIVLYICHEKLWE